MKNSKLTKLVVLILAMSMRTCAVAGCGSDSADDSAVKVGDPDKKAILVVSFGTSYNDTRAVTIDAIEKKIADEFSDEYDVRRAFTAQIIIDKLLERDGLEIDNVEQAMDRLVEDGVGTLIIQSTHIKQGSEKD